MTPALVLLPGGWRDAPRLDGVCTLSTDTERIEGELGQIWVDRPYVTGNPSDDWMIAKVQQNEQAGAFTQCLNEPNLTLEGWHGGPQGYATFYRRVMAGSRSTHVLYAPVSPSGDWPSWIADRNAPCYGVHAYGSYAQMRAIVEWYLANTTGDLFVTECNPGAGRTFDLAAWAHAELAPFLDWCESEPRVRMVAYFAWKWDQSPKLPSSVDAADCPSVIEVLRAVQPYKETTGMLKGIDVSNWQAAIDWPKVKVAGYDFAIAKATEGSNFTDPFFRTNWQAMKAAELDRAAYLFARPDQASPEAHVTLFQSLLETAGGLGPGDKIALDLEAGSGDLLVWAAECLALLESVFGVTPFLYTGDWFARPHNLEDHAPSLGKYPLWWASYTEVEPAPPPGWDRIAIWQSSASASVPGTIGNIDTDVFLGSAEELAALGVAAAPVVVEKDRPLTRAFDRIWGSSEARAAAGQTDDAIADQKSIDVLKEALADRLAEEAA